MCIKFIFDNDFELLIVVKNNKYMHLTITDLSSSKVLVNEEIELDFCNLDCESLLSKSINILRSKVYSEHFIGDVKHAN